MRCFERMRIRHDLCGFFLFHTLCIMRRLVAFCSGGLICIRGVCSVNGAICAGGCSCSWRLVVGVAGGLP